MRTHTVAFGDEKNGVTVEHEAGRTACVSAISQIDNLAIALCADQTYIRVWIVLVSDKFQCKPFAVRRPCIVKSSACTVPGRAIGDPAYFLGFQVEHHQAVTAFNES